MFKGFNTSFVFLGLAILVVGIIGLISFTVTSTILPLR